MTKTGYLSILGIVLKKTPKKYPQTNFAFDNKRMPKYLRYHLEFICELRKESCRMFYQQIIKGSIKFVILSILERKESYGYGLIQTVNQKTKGFFEWRESAVYTALHNMEDAGLIKSKWKSAGVLRKRKYYHIADKGRKLLLANRMEWLAFSKCMNKLITST
jgi:PadR family transcriptional regulator PadR